MLVSADSLSGKRFIFLRESLVLLQFSIQAWLMRDEKKIPPATFPE